MKPSELAAAFEKAKPWLKEWGKYVVDVVTKQFEEIESSVGSRFFVVSPSYRVKTVSEFIAKARRPGKNYKEPWLEITDKVGARFITLLASDAQRVCNFIESHDAWNAVHDRVHEAEKQSKPTEFLYASEHYIVRPVTPIECCGVLVPIEAACEIQVRTLLQHGYSELTHNTIYKGVLASDSDAVRKAARSMALIETTDEIFSAVAKKIADVTTPLITLHAQLEEIWTGLPFLSKLGNTVESKKLLDVLWPDFGGLEGLGPETAEFFAKEQYKAKALLGDDISDTFRQPVGLLLIFLAHNYPRRFEHSAVLSREEIEELSGLTGINLLPS